jgi:hypothetical protein
MLLKTLIVAFPVIAVLYAVARLRFAMGYESARDEAKKLIKDFARYAKMTAAELVQNRLEEVREELRQARSDVELFESRPDLQCWSSDLLSGNGDGFVYALAEARQKVKLLEKQEERIIDFKSRAKAFQADFMARLRAQMKDAETRQEKRRRVAAQLGSRRARRLEPISFSS